MTASATTTTIDRAIAAGQGADRVAYAFGPAYGFALEALTGATGDVSLCVTEAGGNHPRAIATRVDEAGRVTGVKQWATGADRAASLLVCAKAGEHADGRPQLVLVRVATTAPGVTIEASAAAFVPEIAHAKVTLVDAPGERLPGDGYADYVKPFRTVEDLHVHAALLGYFGAVAQRIAAPHALRETLAMLAMAARGLAGADPKSPATHIALAGLIDATTRALGELEPLWSTHGGDEWTRWERDRAIVKVASKARAERRVKAWESLG